MTMPKPKLVPFEEDAIAAAKVIEEMLGEWNPDQAEDLLTANFTRQQWATILQALQEWTG